MNLSSLKIGYKDYKIIKWDKDVKEVRGASRNAGETHNYDGKIYIDTHHKDKVEVANTLVHEILHAIWFIYNIQQGDDEERVVNTTANGLMQVLADNPDLLVYLRGVLRCKASATAS